MLRYIFPNPLTAQYIKHYFCLHFVFDAQTKVPVKPYPACPDQGITFYVRGKLFSEIPEMGVSENRARSVIMGQNTCRHNLYSSNDYIMFHVSFQPGAFFQLFRIPMTEFVDKNVDAELVLGNGMKQLHEQMANAKSLEELPNIFETFLLKKIGQADEFIRPVDKIGKLIFDSPQSFKFDTYASMACLSISQFERTFTRQVGISPKFYARICRFYQAYATKQHYPHLSWFTIAIKTGYSDYQHLAKDFKQFAGNTPNTLLAETERSPEQILGYSDFLSPKLLHKIY
ncbi:helix-turn-helix domain-containing protein [Mucilaginibacter sp. RB4R14]|uniref:helix-turn-helix domain-containing protein n=1 Tax=Mucilaginibacter aurantiaciroseus TaxID=2949308 RepID=UPI002091504F|nr:helix-turn-helix domain-containing protein [Mucilaginibacter aurantiaciroseus]MCO5935902.1 helix-turn-helix domain-containing protein [Mucilaginibacter aurantiaciroseus]